jgi:hypothetical protein
MILSRKMLRPGGLLCLLSMSLYVQPAFAQAGSQFQPSRSGAFAGAAFTVGLGDRAKPPAARLQLGMRTLAGDRGSAGALSTRHVPALEIGFAGKESGRLFVAGQSKAEVERKLGLSAGTPKAVWIGLSVALVVVATVVLINLNNLDLGQE